MKRRGSWAVAGCVGVSVLALLGAVAPAAQHLLVAAAVLAKVTGMQLPAALERRLLREIVEEPMTLRTSSGQVRARRYTPRDVRPTPAPPVLLLHGVHALGIAEPRLVGLARALAQGGLDVLTPELTQLTHYEVDAALVADIRAQAEAWAQATASPAVGVIGISFSGGLALMAAAEQAAKRPIGFVASVGGHADLLRVCAYYAGRDVRGPDGEPPAVAPHPYGARVMLRGHLASLVSPSDLPGALEALDTYLHDKPHAAQRLAEKLSPDARKVMDVLLDEGGSDTLSTWLMQVAHSHRQQLLAASPHGHLAGLKVPVLLLHGSSDPVVPSIETRYLAREVPAAALHVVLITDLLRHADFPEAPAPSQAYQLARFMQRLFGVAGGMAAASQR